MGALYTGSGRCLDLENPDNGGWAVTTDCNGSDRQQWRLTRGPDDQYMVVNLAGSGCLDVENASHDDGARIVQWTCHDADNQRWVVRPDMDTFTLVNAYSGMCATVEGDGKLRQRTCGTDPAQRLRASAPTPAPSPSSSSAPPDQPPGDPGTPAPEQPPGDPGTPAPDQSPSSSSAT
ncbi:RICIN domain-containing protein [Planosporangium sp. 12N6]|uniref:RICIN domain-containing protein n=1 Tax=Planosporangium spinosum TaxID=3402278 RepID=UPI003CF5025C